MSKLSIAKIERLTRAFVADVLLTIETEVAQHARKLAPQRRARAKRTEAEMRCRHTTRAGKRCTKRSRGPRFRYLCTEHGK
jgi:hypothetical protein